MTGLSTVRRLPGIRDLTPLGFALGAGGGGYVLPTPVLLESFDGPIGNFSVGSAFASGQIKSSPKVQGTGAFYGEGTGVSATTPLLTRANDFNLDPSTLDVLAYAIRLDERGQNLVTMQVGRGGTYVGLSKSYNGFPPGWRFEAVHVSEISGLPTGVAQTDVRLRLDSQLAPYNTRISADCFMGNAKGRPTILFGFDDGYRTTPDLAQPYMASKGLVGTVYLPWAQIGEDSGSRVSDRMIVPEVRTLAAAGWAICLDGTRDDGTMVSRASPAVCAAEIQEGQAWLASHSFPAEGGLHICYPNGFYQGDSSGNPTVAVQVAAATGNGTTTVTFGAALTVSAGMRMRGRGIPDNTRIAPGSGGAGVTSVVVTNVIPAQTLAADFIDDSGAFYYPALPNALAGVGVVSARSTLQDNMYTRFGFGDQALVGRAHSTSGATFAALKPFIDQAVLRGETCEFYIHHVNSTGTGIDFKDTEFYQLIDYVAGLKSAGVLDVLTKPQLYNRDVNGLAKLPF